MNKQSKQCNWPTTTVPTPLTRAVDWALRPDVARSETVTVGMSRGSKHGWAPRKVLCPHLAAHVE